MDKWFPISVITLLTGTFGAIYKVFSTIENDTREEAKRHIADWLRGLRTSELLTSVSTSVVAAHSQLFGERQFSLKCLRRTFVWSFLAVLMSLVSSLVLYRPSSQGLAIGFNKIDYVMVVLFLFFIYNLPVEFLSIAITRFLSKRLGEGMSLARGLLLIGLDFVLKFMLAFVFFLIDWALALVIWFSFFASKEEVAFWRQNSEARRKQVEGLASAGAGSGINMEELVSSALESWVTVLLVVWAAMVICAMWVWMYFVGLHLLRFFLWLFDSEKHPVKAVGIFMACLITLAEGFIVSLWTLAR